MSALELERPELLPAAGVLSITSITLDGVALDLHGVLADVTIRHGRAGYFDSASPSTCQLTLLGVSRSFTRPFRLGSLLVVSASDGATVAPRFTGRLTDADLDGSTLTAIAVGRLRTLSGYTVGTVDYPEEEWSARVARAFAEAGLGTPSPTAFNGGFEVDVSNWYPMNGTETIVRVTTEHRYGAAAGKITATAAGLGVYLFNIYTPGGTIPLGTLVEGQLWVKGQGSAIGKPFWAQYVSTGASGGDSVVGVLTGVILTGSWQLVRFGGAVTAPAVPTTIYLIAWIATGAASGDVVYLDGLTATLNPVLELEVGAFDPLLLARPAAPVSLDSYLGELATTVESAVADRPDGRILVQAIGARSLDAATGLDPAEIAYSPAWVMRLPAGNVVAVKYGAPEAAISVSDAASVGLYGPIRRELSTTIKNASDATAEANALLARGAYALWTIPAAALLVGRRLAIGAPVVLSSLPPAAPFPTWAPILEGWTDTVVSDGDELVWTMDLALSDPLLSGLLTLSWQAVPVDAAHHWNTINQTVAWRDALVLSDLDP